MQGLDGTNVGVVVCAAEQIARQLFEQLVLIQNSTYIATGLGGTTIAAMEAGEIDWAITFEPGMTMGVKKEWYSSVLTSWRRSKCFGLAFTGEHRTRDLLQQSEHYCRLPSCYRNFSAWLKMMQTPTPFSR